MTLFPGALKKQKRVFLEETRPGRRPRNRPFFSLPDVLGKCLPIRPAASGATPSRGMASLSVISAGSLHFLSAPTVPFFSSPSKVFLTEDGSTHPFNDGSLPKVFPSPWAQHPFTEGRGGGNEPSKHDLNQRSSVWACLNVAVAKREAFIHSLLYPLPRSLFTLSSLFNRNGIYLLKISIPCLW